MNEALLEKVKIYRKLIEKAVQTLSDEESLKCVTLYEKWSGNGVEYAYGKKVRHNGKLYKTIPANHTFQADWIPGVGTESLYTRIDDEHDGTQYDPIPYDGNMELTEGLYYTQDSVTYLCIRGTGQPVYNTLADLVGLYVEGV